ncbi:MAG: ubiquitin-like domain-containing protein [Bacillota bacterium]
MTQRARRRPLAAVGAIVVIVLALTVSSLVMAQRTVQVAVDGKTVTVRTMARTVEGALLKGGIDLGPHDRVDPGLESRLPRQATVTIIRAIAVTIKADGKTLEAFTTNTTAAEALAEAGLTVEQSDRVTVTKDKKKLKVDAPLVAGVTIEVFRRDVKTVTEQRAIPAEAVYRDDASLPLGITQVAQAGKDGVAQVTLQVTLENGRRVASKEISRQVVREPEMKVVLKGTSGLVTRGGRDITFKKAFQMVATAYYPGPDSTGPYATGYTSTGMKATYGVVAVDPRVIPLHSLLYIDGYGYAIAGDVGSAIKGNKIDLCYDTKQEALDWGKRSVMVFLIK